MKRFVCILCGLLCALSMALPAAAESDSESQYCFAVSDFASEEMQLAGICITRLPEATQGSVMLGRRCLRAGDVLTADQLSEMTFVAAQEEQDCNASISYLPVFADGLSGEATMHLSLRGKENKPPVAEDAAFETYKNLELTGKLRVHDPEGQAMNFTVTRQPRRGTLTIHEDGSFTYAPKKNKVGVDSFTFTAADPAGKTSRETTVTVTILKPTDAKQYSDTRGRDCRFAAEWMKHSGIFVGESIGGSPCFSPDRPVSRGEFVTMLVKSLNIPTDPAVTETGYADAPDWLKPYLAAAIRSGLTSGIPSRESFGADEVITADEAAAMLCIALDLHMVQQPALSAEDTARDSIAVAVDNGFELTAGQVITRADAAMMLYQAAQFEKANPAAV